MRLIYKVHERWIFGGKTGSGKTQFAKFLLRPVSAKIQVAIVDIKNMWLGESPIWEEDKREPGTIDKPWLVTKFDPKKQVQVIQPIEYDDTLDKFFKDVLKHKNVHVHIDDTAGLVTATQVPMPINRVWTQGRALKIGASVGAQTYSRIPNIFKSQAEKFVIFKVGRNDAKDFADLCNLEEIDIINLGKYEYVFYDNTEMDTGIWFPPLKLEQFKDDKQEVA
jgi:hypothetical protein